MTVEYDVAEPIIVEDVFLGERFRLECGPGKVKAKNEREEAALEAAAALRPGIVKRVRKTKG